MEDNHEHISNKPRIEKSGRTKETLFRITLRNQVRLTAIADSKANMVIGINALIISIILTVASTTYLQSSDRLIEHKIIAIPVFLMVMGSLLSVVYAILAARPLIIKPKINRKNDFREKVSLLFFEVFHAMPQKEYIREMEHLLENKKEIYNHMTIDIHNQGKVLHKKFRLLAISYTIFMSSFIVSVLTFLLIWFLS